MRVLELAKANAVTGLAFSPDGSLLATTQTGCNVRVCGLTAGGAVSALDGTVGARQALFVAGTHGLRLCVPDSVGRMRCRLVTGEPVALPPWAARLVVATVSPDGTRLVGPCGSRQPPLGCVDAATGESRWRSEWCGQYAGLAFDATGTRLVVVTEAPPARVAQVLDAADGRTLDEFVVFSAYGHLALSPGGRWLAGLDGSRLIVFDTATGAQALEVEWPARSALAFTPDGRTLAVTAFAEVETFAVGTWQRGPSMRPEVGTLGALAFSPDGMLAAAGGSGRVAVWDVG